MERYCLDCGEVVGPDDKFCYYCGEELPDNDVETEDSEPSGKRETVGGDQMSSPTEGHSPRTARSRKNERSPGRYCLDCGELAAVDDTFCYFCGERLPVPDTEADTARDNSPSVEGSQDNRCPDCGEVAEPDDAFCFYCGERLQRPSNYP